LLAIPGDTIGILLQAPLGLVTAAAVFILFRRQRWTLLRWVVPFVPLLLCPLHEMSKTYGSLDYMTIYGTAALPLYLVVRRDWAARSAFIAIWPAALIGGIATSWTSANGGRNFALGFAAAPVVTSVLLSVVGWRMDPTLAPRSSDRRIAAFLATSTAVALLMLFQFTSIYRDAGFTRLNARIHGGPYAGILTTQARRQMINTMSADLERLSPADCRILFFDGFPAGYLMSRSRPDTNAVFTLTPEVLLGLGGHELAAYRRLLLDYYRAGSGLPDVVVRMTNVPGEDVRRPIRLRDDLLDRTVANPRMYSFRQSRSDYSIYTRRDAVCTSTHE
jgi:hypothetical protein